MTTKKYDQFSNFPEGYAEAQLEKLRNIRHRLYPDWVTQNTRERDQRITALETFNDYQEKQRVGGEVR
jgi:hypothetical protein